MGGGRSLPRRGPQTCGHTHSPSGGCSSPFLYAFWCQVPRGERTGDRHDHLQGWLAAWLSLAASHPPLCWQPFRTWSLAPGPPGAPTLSLSLQSVVGWAGLQCVCKLQVVKTQNCLLDTFSHRNLRTCKSAGEQRTNSSLCCPLLGIPAHSLPRTQPEGKPERPGSRARAGPGGLVGS